MTMFHCFNGGIYVTILWEVDERTPKQERIYQQCPRIIDNIKAEMRRHMNKWLKRCIEAEPKKLPKPRPGQPRKPVKIVGLRKLSTLSICVFALKCTCTVTSKITYNMLFTYIHIYIYVHAHVYTHIRRHI